MLYLDNKNIFEYIKKKMHITLENIDIAKY